ncbi:uncharacterized protein LOC122858574 [Aphidius gifuensis]|uniref:uncharacterized protein LOC122858574 n=1 Tax=Aphidius gifuensis TaxID=684658 RepID=UPI001CDCAEEE|nr:uncharacterized protein LOC122858574 [Aphidius gifuensis]
METNQSDQINVDLSPTEWREKFILISQEELKLRGKLSRSDVLDEIDDSEDKNEDDNDDWENYIDYIEINKRGKKLTALHNMRMTRLAPLFVNQPRFKKICEQLDNNFFRSCFKTFIFECHSANELQEQINNLIFIINFCGSGLTSLHIQDAHPFNNQIIQLIKNNCPNLETLGLAFEEIKRRDLTNLFSRMSHLEWLSIEWRCENSTLPMSLVKSLEQVGGTLKFLYLKCFTKNNHFSPDSLALVFPRLIVLESLCLTDFELSQPLLESIGQMQNLVHLMIMYDRMFDKKVDMCPIGNLKNLSTLHIECGVTDEFLINLCNNAEKLRELGIMGTHITDKGLFALGNLKQLNKLCLTKHFSNKPVKNNEFITDKSIQYLLNEKLIALDLSNCIEINNSSVIKLVENLPNLLELTIKNTKVTYDVVKEISKLKKKKKTLLTVFVSFEDRDGIFESLKQSANVNFRTRK